MIKVGDKVRFLNATGGGIVTKINGKDLITVEDADGFDVPVLIKECVVVESALPKGASVKAASPQVITNSVIGSKVEQEIELSRKVKETKEGETLDILLAFVPQNLKSLQQSTYDTYLLNDSNYFLFVTYSSEVDGQWINRYCGVVEPNTKLFMEELGKEQLNEIERVSVQFVAFKTEKRYNQKNPVLVEHNIDTIKFYKLHSFKVSEYFDEPALIYTIVKNDVPDREIVFDPKALEEAMQERLRSERIVNQPLFKKKSMVQSDLIEVDLHIDELLDTTAGMDNTAMFEVQIEEFHRVMKSNLKTKGQKIVFIHGKGDGVLRKAIIDQLNKKYKSCIYQDASFREYGYGATMVIIK
ncbi:MAG: DUF2027 domain-containing protein [Bacteroidales bacterium]